jgi:hypothetical protein
MPIITLGSGSTISVTTSAGGGSDVNITVPGPPPASYRKLSVTGDFVTACRDQKNHLDTPKHTVSIEVDANNEILKITSKQEKS